MKQMAVYSYSFQGQITEPLRKANTMMILAQQMKYNIGIVLSYYALGDTYLNANMDPEAVEEFEKAMILYKIQASEKLQERVSIQLIPTLVKLKRMNEAEGYLEKMSMIYKSTHLNPFLLYIYQAYYCLRIDDLSKAHKCITDSEKANNEEPSYFYAAILNYMQAEYARKTGNYEHAIELYNNLAENSNSIITYNNYLKIRK